MEVYDVRLSALVDDLTTLSCIQSFVNSYFYFSEKVLNFRFFKNNYFRQLDYSIISFNRCQPIISKILDPYPPHINQI